MNRLNEIEARANAATEGPWNVFMGRIDHPGRSLVAVAYDVGCDEDAEFIAHARTDVHDMAAALRAVLEIHQDGGESQGYLDDGSYGFIPHCCMECGSLGEYGVPYPCPTVETIRRYLGDDL